MAVAHLETPILDMDQAAKFLGIAKSTLYVWVHKRKRNGLPVRHMGRLVKFHKNELEDWFKKSAKKA